MKDKILLINYYWPPCGGPAVQRWLDITRFLAEKNIQTHVVTVDESVATFTAVDPSLKARIDPSTRVYTTDTSELFHIYKKYFGKGKIPATGMADEPSPGFLQKVGRFVRGNFFLPDPRRGWNKHAFAMAAKVIREEGIKIVFTAGPPHSSHLIGLQLKKEFPDIKWVADFHDYWTDISYLSLFYRTWPATVLDKRLERKVLNGADAVMTHCGSAQQMLRDRITRGNKEKVFVHTIGFNEELFPAPPAPQPQEKFVVSYVGMIASNYHPEPFFRAVKEAIAAVPEVPLVLRFVGKFGDGIMDMVRSCSLESHLELHGYVPHKDSIAFLRQSSALFIINPQYDNEKVCIPGKLYEYLATFKPIISVSPADSETGSIIQHLDAGKNFARNDMEGIRGYLIALMQEWKIQRELDLEYSPEVQQLYGRRTEAFALAERIRSMN